MGMSASHVLLLVVVAALLFGRNKISDLMGDVAKGIKSFKKGIADDPVVEVSSEHSGVKTPHEIIART